MTSSSRKQRSPRLFLGLAPHEIAERTEREKRLRNIMASAEGRAQEILAQHGGNASAQKAILNLRHQLVEEAHNVMYPSISREELQQRRQTFGNVKWTEDAMQRLCSFSPLVEVGAGEGQWQAELRRRGADVIAFDNHSSPSRFGDEASSRIMVPGAEVQRADAEAAMSGSVGRTLLLVYPPPGDMASRCLSAYGGETLIYPALYSLYFMSGILELGNSTLELRKRLCAQARTQLKGIAVCRYSKSSGETRRTHSICVKIFGPRQTTNDAFSPSFFGRVQF
ncbi:unnamed protein product [Durusdinium trenchii]